MCLEFLKSKMLKRIFKVYCLINLRKNHAGIIATKNNKFLQTLKQLQQIDLGLHIFFIKRNYTNHQAQISLIFKNGLRIMVKLIYPK